MTAADQPASASFHVETTEAGMDEYLARHRAEDAKMTKMLGLDGADQPRAQHAPRDHVGFSTDADLQSLLPERVKKIILARNVDHAREIWAGERLQAAADHLRLSVEEYRKTVLV